MRNVVTTGKTWIVLLSWMVFLNACDRSNKISLPAYIEGKYTYVSSNYSGTLSSIVNLGENIKKDQLLFALEALPEQADFLAAKARVKEAINLSHENEAKFFLQKKNLERRRYLYSKKIISKEELDTSVSEYQQNLQRLQSNKQNILAKQADLEKASWVAKQKQVYAPISSMIFDVYYYKGEWVQAGKPVVALLDPTQLKIIFYLPETLLHQIRINQLIEINCDNCANIIKGKITYISPKAEYTPPMIYSTEERVKFVYRIEAIPLIPYPERNLHAGQPVTVFLSS